MFVRSINIAREGAYYGSYHPVDPTKPFMAKISVEGVTGEVTLALSSEMSRRIVEIIADEVAAAGRATAEAMTAEAFNGAALPAPEAA